MYSENLTGKHTTAHTTHSVTFSPVKFLLQNIFFPVLEQKNRQIPKTRLLIANASNHTVTLSMTRPPRKKSQCPLFYNETMFVVMCAI